MVVQTELPIELLPLEAEPNAIIQPMVPLVPAAQQVLHQRDQMATILDLPDQMMHQQERILLQLKVLLHHRVAAADLEEKVEAHHQAQAVVVAVVVVGAADQQEGAADNLN